MSFYPPGPGYPRPAPKPTSQPAEKKSEEKNEGLGARIAARIPSAFRRPKIGLVLIFFAAYLVGEAFNIATSLDGFMTLGGKVMQAMIVPFLAMGLFAAVRIVTPERDMDAERDSILAGVLVYVLSEVLNGGLTWFSVTRAAIAQGTLSQSGSIWFGGGVSLLNSVIQIVALLVATSMLDKMLAQAKFNTQRYKAAQIKVSLWGIIVAGAILFGVNWYVLQYVLVPWIGQKWGNFLTLALLTLNAGLTIGMVVSDKADKETEGEIVSKIAFWFFAVIVGGLFTSLAVWSGMLDADFVTSNAWIWVIAVVLALVFVAAQYAVALFATVTTQQLAGQSRRGPAPAAGKPDTSWPIPIVLQPAARFGWDVEMKSATSALCHGPQGERKFWQSGQPAPWARPVNQPVNQPLRPASQINRPAAPTSNYPRPAPKSSANQPVLRSAAAVNRPANPSAYPRPAPKPVSSQRTTFVPPEPTYHPVDQVQQEKFIIPDDEL